MDYDYCDSKCEENCDCEKKNKLLLEDANENFWREYFFGVMYGMVLSAVILLR